MFEEVDQYQDKAAHAADPAENYVDDGFELSKSGLEAVSRWLQTESEKPAVAAFLRRKSRIPFEESLPEEWL